MGAWGVGIFDNDDSMDVRDAWESGLADGSSPAEATEAVIAAMSDFWQDEDTAPDFWIALAALQVGAGALDGNVASKAQAYIPHERDRWKELGASQEDCEGRTEALADLNEQISPNRNE
jgi:hypothetical protein